MGGGRGQLVARVVAPLAFLLAVTIGVLLARSAVAPADPVRPVAARTAPAGTTAAAPPPTTTAAPVPTATTATVPEGTFYTVEPGDTLAAIADEYGTTVEAIVELNPGIDPVALVIGQQIRVG